MWGATAQPSNLMLSLGQMGFGPFVPSGGQQSVQQVQMPQSSGWGNSQTFGEAIGLPDYSYSYQYQPKTQVGLGILNQSNVGDYGAFTRGDVATDYYTKLAQDYLPKLSSWSQQNAGRMVDLAGLDSHGMTAADFGVVWRRGDSHGQIDPGYWIGDKYYNESRLNYNYDTKQLANYDQFSGSAYDLGDNLYYKDESGKYQPATRHIMGGENDDGRYVITAPEGAELFRAKDGGIYGNSFLTARLAGGDQYESIGKYKPEKTKDYIDRLLSTGGLGNTKDKFFSDSIKSGKFKEYYPDYAHLIDDPNWVKKDDQGNIVSARAELVPMLTAAGIQQNMETINQGYRERSDGLGSVIKSLAPALILGPAAGALASGMGLTGAAATAATGAMAGAGSALVAGGGLDGALRGALMGGIGGGLGGTVGASASKALQGYGLSSNLANALTNAGMSAAMAGISGGNPLQAALTSGIGSYANGALRPNPKYSLANGNNGLGLKVSEGVLNDFGLTSTGNTDGSFWDYGFVSPGINVANGPTGITGIQPGGGITGIQPQTSNYNFESGQTLNKSKMLSDLAKIGLQLALANKVGGSGVQVGTLGQSPTNTGISIPSSGGGDLFGSLPQTQPTLRKLDNLKPLPATRTAPLMWGIQPTFI